MDNEDEVLPDGENREEEEVSQEPWNPETIPIENFEVIRVEINDTMTLFYRGSFYLEIDDPDQDETEYVIIDDDTDYTSLPKDEILESKNLVEEYLSKITTKTL